MSQYTTTEVIKDLSYELDGPLKEVITKLQKIQDKHENRGKLFLTVDADEYLGALSIYAKVTLHRDMTPEEIEDRKEKQKVFEQTLVDLRRREYLKLKREFES